MRRGKIILSLLQDHSSADTVFACGNLSSVPLLAAVQWSGTFVHVSWWKARVPLGFTEKVAIDGKNMSKVAMMGTWIFFKWRNSYLRTVEKCIMKKNITLIAGHVGQHPNYKVMARILCYNNQRGNLKKIWALLKNLAKALLCNCSCKKRFWENRECKTKKLCY